MANGRYDGRANLINYHALTDEERFAFHSAGGKRSAELRREKKALKDKLLLLLEAKTETGDVATDMCIALVNRAVDGDTKAFELIRDTIGQKPTDKQQIEMESSNIIISVEDDEQ